MGEFFDIDNLLSGNEVTVNDLFGDDEDVKDTQQKSQKNEESTDENEENDETAETLFADIDDLFGEESEEVSSKDKNKGKEDIESTEDDNDSPDNNFYSSITDALVESSVFRNLSLSKEEIDNIKSPEDFRDLIEKEIAASFDERTKRINEALSVGVEPSEIRNLEGTLNFLGQVTTEIISEESKRGEDIRRRLIQQSYMNRGFAPEKAERLTEKIFASGDDIEEAKEALEDNKLYFNNRYNTIVESAKREEQKYQKERQKQAEDLRKSIMSDGKVFDDVEISKQVRQQVVDNIFKTSYKDPDTGVYLTPIQKYEKENPTEFIKKVGLVFTLTDGFTKMENLVKPAARKEVNNKLKELEATLKNSHSNRGNLKYVGGKESTSNKSIWDKGFVLDIK